MVTKTELTGADMAEHVDLAMPTRGGKANRKGVRTESGKAGPLAMNESIELSVSSES